MLEFLGFGRSKSEVADAEDTRPVARHVFGDIPTPTQREMVRLTLHTLLKRHGIPAAWLAAEIGPFPTTDVPEGIVLRLVVVHWHPGFGLYATALQQELMEGLKRFDPTATANKYHVHWKFPQDCGCPHPHLPEPHYWAAPEPRPKFDLPSRPVDNDDDDHDNGFAATQLHDMR